MPTPERRTALISGASGGIGGAAARALAARNFDLALGGRDLARLQRLVEELSRTHPAGRFHARPFDVRLPSEASEAIAGALADLGRIDVLVVGAGVGTMDFLDRMDPDEGIVRQVETNLTGAILLVRAVLPGMMARRAGGVVLVGSLAGLVATPSYSVYAATKFGMVGFADALRREVAPWGIRVSLLLPGAVATGFADESVRRRRTRMKTPGFLVLTPDQVGMAIARLADRPRRVWLIPWTLRPAILLARLFPGLVDWASRRYFVGPERFTGDDPA